MCWEGREDEPEADPVDVDDSASLFAVFVPDAARNFRKRPISEISFNSSSLELVQLLERLVGCRRNWAGEESRKAIEAKKIDARDNSFDKGAAARVAHDSVAS